MNLATRRKTTAEREPNGRVKREADHPVAEIRRLRDASMAGLRDPLWGTQIGRLYLTSKITDEMLAAGKRWAERTALYSRALGSPSPDPKAMNFDQGLGDEPLDPDSEEGQKEVARHKRAVASFVDAYAALSCSGTKPMLAVRMVVERNEWPDFTETASLCTGLKALADFWGLTESRKSRHVR